MMRPIVRLAGAALFVTALTAFVTWPQIGRLSSHLVEHQDSYFSIWRTSWIAHALITSPLDLFNANIFYPAKGTLAYSDAVLLEGLLTAPLYWAHVSPVLIYNLALLAGFVGSGIGMFVLARYVTGATGPALVSAAAFTLAPYRIEHIMHLELQWAMWVPLTWWALHRAVADSSWRYGVLAGVFFGLQALSCVYYSVFLALTLVVFVPLILVYAGRNAAGAIEPLAAAFVVATVVAGPYVWMYASAGQAVGLRGINEVTKYSAQPISYLATAASNRIWGWTADRWGDSELRLSPGLIVVRARADQRHRTLAQVGPAVRVDRAPRLRAVARRQRHRLSLAARSSVAASRAAGHGAFRHAHLVRARDARGTRGAGADRTGTPPVAASGRRHGRDSGVDAPRLRESADTARQRRHHQAIGCVQGRFVRVDLVWSWSCRSRT